MKQVKILLSFALTATLLLTACNVKNDAASSTMQASSELTAANNESQAEQEDKHEHNSDHHHDHAHDAAAKK